MDGQTTRKILGIYSRGMDKEGEGAEYTPILDIYRLGVNGHWWWWTDIQFSWIVIASRGDIARSDSGWKGRVKSWGTLIQRLNLFS